METTNLIVRRRNGIQKDTISDLKDGLLSAGNEIKENTLAEKREGLSLIENEIQNGSHNKIMEGLSPSENGIQKYTIGEIMEGLSTVDKAYLLNIQTGVQGRIFNIKRDIYGIGEFLYQAKQILPHGMFIPWIELAFNHELPYSTGNFYMRVYELFKGNVKAIQYIPTKYLLMITSKEFPGEIVKVLKDHPEKIDHPGLQQIQEFYNQFKSGEMDSDQFLKLAEKQVKLGIEIWKGGAKHRLNANMRHSLEYGTMNLLKQINKYTDAPRGMAWSFPYDPKSSEHQELIKNLEKTIKGLKDLKIELEGSWGLLKPLSTEEGDKYK